MESDDGNQFAELFKEKKYVFLKNYLYNYRLRKRAVEKCFRQASPSLILEVGSGISPVMTTYNRTVYSDLSYEAVKILKQTRESGYFVVADGNHLPFKSNGFSHVICSEVLEHLSDDRRALREMARTLNRSSGFLIITVPHRRCYFANDDNFVNHHRRYEIAEIKSRLRASGLDPIQIQKILGPLEKITMIGVVFLFTFIQKHKAAKHPAATDRNFGFMALFAYLFKWANLFYMGYVWLEAMILPLSFSSVILIKSIPLNKKC